MTFATEGYNPVSVIIVTHNRKEYLEKCIDSVLNQTCVPEQVIVVDNGSSDNTVNFLRSRFLNLEIIENISNVGFAKAMNKGIERSKGYYTLLLADDLVLAPDCLLLFLKFMKNETDTGLLSGYIYDNYNKKLLFSGKKLTLKWAFKQNEIILKDGIKDTDLILGGFLFTRTDLLRRFKGFDERYFFYFEDLDLSFRFKKAGFRNLILPQTKAFHLEEEPGIKKYKADERIQFELEKNLLITYFKHAKLFWLALFFLKFTFLGFIKNIFDINKRSIIFKTRCWAICNFLDLIRLRFLWSNDGGRRQV